MFSALAAASCIAALLVVFSIPHRHRQTFAPHASWRENFVFVTSWLWSARWQLVVFGSIGLLYLALPAHRAGLLTKEQAARLVSGLSVPFAIAALVLQRASDLSRWQWLLNRKEFILLLAAGVSACLMVVSRAIADDEIQRRLAASPEDFTAAGHALALMYFLWLWIVLSGVLMSVFWLLSTARFLIAVAAPPSGRQQPPSRRKPRPRKMPIAFECRHRS